MKIGNEIYSPVAIKQSVFSLFLPIRAAEIAE